ncbi:MAG TPA: hypothetical protein VMW41_06595 [Candidatus Bathyarchaeia archaeon]|nr:hypothetical protein [Candidatus Bathyarchaeia archaeon]
MLPEIIPTILTKSVEETKSRLDAVIGTVSRVQIDVVDGIFAPNKTVSLEAISQIETSLDYDVHLMVENPLNWIDKSLLLTASRLSAQIEAMPSQEDFVVHVIESGMKVGLALNLKTGIESLDFQILSALDSILLLAVEAGFSGQPFNDQVLGKIKKLKEIREKGNFSFKIGVDGGLDKTNIVSVVEAGTDELAIGSAIYNQKNPAEAIEDLKKLIKNSK